MSESDRHINFKLMRDHILARQDGETPQTGKKYWRSLEELADNPAFTEFVVREYPEHAEFWSDPIERRGFIKLMGASLALAGLSGCVFQPPEKIVPYITQPEGTTPGKPLYFATAATMFGTATPVIVRSNEGRPTKIEGNPDHPNNRPSEFSEGDPGVDPRGSSATDIFTQASILSLYDPDRSKNVTYREDIRTWTSFVGEMRTLLDVQRAKQEGAGIRILTETVTSPTLGAELNAFLAEFKQAKWHQYEPANRDNAHAGAVMALGQPVNTIYRFDLATQVLSLDSDFLSALPGSLRYARDFMSRRRVTEKNKSMNRLYAIETSPSNTGAVADHEWCIKPSEFEAVVRSISAAIAGQGQAKLPSGVDLAPMISDLQGARGQSIVIAGDTQPPVVHALAHAMNAALGNIDKTVFYTDPLEVKSVNQRESYDELYDDLNAGKVELLLIIGGNPAYNSPADRKFDVALLDKNPNLIRVHLSQYKDETSDLCHWHVNEAHFLESWGDARSYDGTLSIVQPLIEPLYDGKTALELLAVFSAEYDRKSLDIVKQYWQRAGFPTAAAPPGQPATTPAPQGARSQAALAPAQSQPTSAGVPQPQAAPSPAGRDFEGTWRKALHDGFVPNSAFATKQLTAQANFTAPASASAASSGFEVVFRTDPSLYDGRFANNGWLQELPRPLTKVTWDNVALISPNSAGQLGFTSNGGSIKGREHYVPLADLTVNGRQVRVPLWITPGQPDNVLTIHLGYGRTMAGSVGGKYEHKVGFDAYQVRESAAPWFASGAQLKVQPLKYELATTQLHFNLEDPEFMKEPRDIARTFKLKDFLEKSKSGESAEVEHETLYPPFPKLENSPNYAWGMAIDLNNCVGCNACTIACQAENNIPIVGKEQVARSREMHWIRIDTYFRGFDPVKPEGTNFMPVPCMHCENAPCEPVCPVHATVHSAEGLNDMVYNRCVGTKYCSNNCPYKVRRFNFFLYNDWETPQYQLMRNPEVTVRSRGVMEKCTYCVQRIQGAKIQSELEGRRVQDGDIVTACQSVCPTEAIVFGDISDPNSRVSKVKANQRDYSLLDELNTKPRTSYLAQLKNPNDAIKG